jgi:TPR repeat protein
VAEAEVKVEDLYLYDNGVEKDYELALQWYTKASNKGDADAAFSVGQIYHKGGYGVKKD